MRMPPPGSDQYALMYLAVQQFVARWLAPRLYPADPAKTSRLRKLLKAREA